MTLEEFLNQTWHPSTVTMHNGGFEVMIVADDMTVVVWTNTADSGPAIQIRDEILLAHNVGCPEQDSVAEALLIAIRFGGMDGRLDSMEARLGSVESRLGSMDTRLGSVDARLRDFQQDTREHFVEVDAHLERIEQHTEQIVQDVDALARDVIALSGRGAATL